MARSTTPVALVLCGGESIRMGGTDKTRIKLHGKRVLDHVLDSLPGDWQVIAIGEPRKTSRTVRWARETPHFGGPLAGIAAGVAATDDLDQGSSTPVVVLAGDSPYAGQSAALLAGALLAAPKPIDGVSAIDSDGVQQPLLAAYRLGALRTLNPDQVRDLPARALLSNLRCISLPVPSEALADLDTPADLHAATQGSR